MRIGSYNVHTFHDASWTANEARVARLLKGHKVDAACLSEAEDSDALTVVTKDSFPAGAGVRSGHMGVGYCGTEVIMNARVIAPVSVHKIKGFPRRSTVVRCTVLEDHSKNEKESKIESGGAGGSSNDCEGSGNNDCGAPLVITCVHLNYRYENSRLKQLETVLAALGSAEVNVRGKRTEKSLSSTPGLICGDFNALSRDIDPVYLGKVASIRKANNWEEPRFDVCDRLASEGWTDIWSHAASLGRAIDAEMKGKEAFGTTCRFDTRIDYIWANEAFMESFEVLSCEVVRSEASDHSLVLAEFGRKNGREKGGN